MRTRREWIEAVGERYRRSDRSEKRAILDEFVQVTVGASSRWSSMAPKGRRMGRRC